MQIQEKAISLSMNNVLIHILAYVTNPMADSDRDDVEIALARALRQLGELSLEGGLLAQVGRRTCEPQWQTASRPPNA